MLNSATEHQIKFSRGNDFEIDYPRRFEFKPNDDLFISVTFNTWCRHSASVDITYKGRRIDLLGEIS